MPSNWGHESHVCRILSSLAKNPRIGMALLFAEKNSKMAARNSSKRSAGQLQGERAAMREIGHFIGGKEVKSTSGRFGDVFNPNTGEVQAKVAYAKHSEVEHAIAVAE